MFPLSTNFVELSQLSLLFTICSVSYVIALRWIFTAPVPLIAVFAFYKWTAHTTMVDGVTFFYLTILLFALLCVSAVWAFLIAIALPYLMQFFRPLGFQRPGILVLLGLAVLPGVAVLLFAFERQTIPDSACANEGIAVVLDGHGYYLRPQLSASIRILKTNKIEPVQLWYSDLVDHKEDLKSACEISQESGKQLALVELKVYPRSISGSLNRSCTESGVDTEDACAGLANSVYDQVRSISFTDSLETQIRLMPSWFKQKNNPTVLTGGDLQDGFVCWGDDTKNEKVHCKVWFPIGESVWAVTDSIDTAGVSKVELVETLRKAVDFTVATITR